MVRINPAFEVDQARPIKVHRELSVKYAILGPHAQGSKKAFGSCSVSGGGKVSARDNGSQPTFDRERTQWEMSCTGFGMLLGGLAAGTKGAALGGIVGYVWGHQRWSDPGV